MHSDIGVAPRSVGKRSDQSDTRDSLEEILHIEAEAYAYRSRAAGILFNQLKRKIRQVLSGRRKKREGERAYRVRRV